MDFFARIKTLPLLAALFILLALTPAPAQAGAAGLWDQLDTSLQPDANGGAGYVLREDIAKRFTLSAIGDSLTDNNVLKDVLYDRLNNADFPFRSIPGGTTIRRHPTNGGTTDSILGRVWSGNWGAGEGADFVLIMAGTNDLDYYGGDATQLATTMVSNVQEMVYSVLGGQTDPATRPAVIVMGIPCYLDQELTSRAKIYNNLLRSSLQHVDIVSDANWYDLYDANTGAAQDWLMDDFKHPNNDGMYRVAENWFEAIDALYNPTRISDDSHIFKGDWYFQRQ